LYIRNILLLESSEALKHQRNLFTAYKKPPKKDTPISEEPEKLPEDAPVKEQQQQPLDKAAQRSEKFSLNFFWQKGPGGDRGNLRQEMRLELLPNTIIRLTAWAGGLVMFLGSFSPLWATFQKSLSPLGPATFVDNSLATYIFNEPIVVTPITGVAGENLFEVLERHFQHSDGFFDAFVFSPQLIRIENACRFNPQGVLTEQRMKFLGQHFEMVKCHLMAKEGGGGGEEEDDPKMAVFSRWKEVNLGTLDKIIEPLDVRFAYEDSEQSSQSTFEMSKDVDIAVSVQEFFLLTCLAAEWRLSRKQEEAKPTTSAPVDTQSALTDPTKVPSFLAYLCYLVLKNAKTKSS